MYSKDKKPNETNHQKKFDIVLKRHVDITYQDWNTFYSRLGNNIRTLRTYFNLTQEYMAMELDISCSGYGKIERNKIEISVKRLFQISAILGVPIELLLYLDANQITIFNKG